MRKVRGLVYTVAIGYIAPARRRCCDNAAAAAAANTKLAALQTELDEAKAAAAAKEMALDERNEQLTQSVLRGDELQKKLQEAEAAAVRPCPSGKA